MTERMIKIHAAEIMLYDKPSIGSRNWYYQQDETLEERNARLLRTYKAVVLWLEHGGKWERIGERC